MISIQHQDFDHAVQYSELRKTANSDGAIVTFTGLVRDFNAEGKISHISLEHYPGMTEKSLSEICKEANKRWQLGDIRIIHRVGELKAAEQIVFVGVSSRHRKSAFEACEFIIDYLKVQAPLWKQEKNKDGWQWLNAKDSDVSASERWQKDEM